MNAVDSTVFEPASSSEEERVGQIVAASCAACDAASSQSSDAPVSRPHYVYALGRVQPRMASVALEKEIAQAIGRAGSDGLTDNQTLVKVLSERKNRYLVRKICWVLTIEQIDTYILIPQDPSDYELLVEAIRVRPSPADIDAVVGVQGPMAPPSLCNGLAVPIVSFAQLYSFDRGTLIDAIPSSTERDAEKFSVISETVLDRIMRLVDNAGSADEHRALNYLSLRYSGLYDMVAELLDRNFTLASVDVRPSAVNGGRKIVDCIFGFRNRTTDVVESHFIRVDVTEVFPFLVAKRAPYLYR